MAEWEKVDGKQKKVLEEMASSAPKGMWIGQDDGGKHFISSDARGVQAGGHSGCIMYVRDAAGPRRLDFDQLIFRHLRIKPNLGALGGLNRMKKANGEKSMQKGTHRLSNDDPISRPGSNHPRATCASLHSL